MKSQNSHYAKIILLLVYLASVTASMNQFKVPTMMQQLMHTLNISLSSAGWLMSIFALVGVILALPSGVLMQKLGQKTFALIGLSALLVGSIMGSFSSHASMLLGSRVIEGMGMCLISVMAPAAISAWYEPDKRGIPMGIWASWVPMGTILMFNIAPALGANKGWEYVWHFASASTFVALILVLLFFKMPPKEITTHSKSTQDTNLVKDNPYANKNIWLLAFVFCIFNVMVLSINTFLPLFLETVRKLPPIKASSTASIVMIVVLLAGPLAGVVSDWISSRKKILFLGCLLACASIAFVFQVDDKALIAVLIIVGMTVGMVPTATFSAAPEVMKNPSQAGIAMSIVAFGQNLGMFIGPVFFGAVANTYSWVTASYILAVLLAFACVCTYFIKVR